jgi:hypothetical protein
MRLQVNRAVSDTSRETLHQAMRATAAAHVQGAHPQRFPRALAARASSGGAWTARVVGGGWNAGRMNSDDEQLLRGPGLRP